MARLICLASISLALLWAACAGSVSDQDAGSDGQADGVAGDGDGPAGDLDGGGGSDPGADLDTGCDLDTAVPPWPAWVPDWPGQGRNASGLTTYRMLAEGPEILDLRVAQLGPTWAVVAWSTAGDCDSSVAWGPSPDSCPVGYHRTGARRDHRMWVGPLVPGEQIHVQVRSRDATSQARAGLDLTTPSQTAAVELDVCGPIESPGRYRLTADVTAACTCFDITAADVELDLGWHTVTYAQSEAGAQCHGVQARAGDVRVARGVVVQGAAGGDLYSHALVGRSAQGLTFEQLWVRVHTADAFGLRTMYAGDVTVRDVLIVSEVREVTDRHYPGNRGIGLDLAPADAPARVHDCVLFGVPHWGIMLTGDERLDQRPAQNQTRLVANNHVFAHMHATNGYALGVHANHVEVAHNEIRPLSNGRAIHYTASNGHLHHNIVEAVELISGDPAAGFAYYSDEADPHSPHDPNVCSWVVAHGIRVEGGNYGLIDHNEVVTYNLPQVSFGATGLNINTDAGARGGLEIHHNQFTARLADGAITCNGGPLPTLAGWVRGEPPAEPADLHHNRFESDRQALLIEDPALATSTDDELIGD